MFRAESEEPSYNYAVYPLRRNQSFFMQAVAEVAFAIASIASCARRYPVIEKSIRKGVGNYVARALVQYGHSGPKLVVDAKIPT